MIKPVLFTIRNDGLYLYPRKVRAITVEQQKRGESCIEPGPVMFAANGSAREWPLVMITHEAALLATIEVFNQLSDSGINIAQIYPAGIYDVQSKALGKKPRPEYFWTAPGGGVHIDELKTEEPGSYDGLRWTPRLDTWNRNDLFRAANRDWAFLFCSARFLLLARKHCWKQLRFCPLDIDPTSIRKYPKNDGIDFLGKQWPPLWYPPGIEGHPSNLEEVAEL